MQNASDAIRWSNGSLGLKLSYLHRNILNQTDKCSSRERVVFLGKNPDYKLPLVSALEKAASQTNFKSLVIANDTHKVSAQFSKLISDCPPWLNRRSGIGRWEFGPKGSSGNVTLSSLYHTDFLSDKYDSVHIVGFETDPETFKKLAGKLQPISGQITWYPFRIYPRDHPFITDVVIPAIHNKALFLAR